MISKISGQEYFRIKANELALKHEQIIKTKIVQLSHLPELQSVIDKTNQLYNTQFQSMLQSNECLYLAANRSVDSLFIKEIERFDEEWQDLLKTDERIIEFEKTEPQMFNLSSDMIFAGYHKYVAIDARGAAALKLIEILRANPELMAHQPKHPSLFSYSFCLIC